MINFDRLTNEFTQEFPNRARTHFTCNGKR